MSTYAPELGQSVFGNAWGEVDGDAYTSGLVTLAERLEARDIWRDRYAEEYRNEVFEIRDYWWGDCTCGFEEQEYAWSEAHAHKPECFNVRIQPLHDKFGGYPTRDESKLIQEAKAIGWMRDDTRGILAYCDCGHDAEYATWRQTHEHTLDCKEVIPNFRHHASGFEIRWYKWIGRGMSANFPLSPAEWNRIIEDCLASAQNTQETNGDPA